MRFRDDILRGVRLFLIVFAGVLVCVWAYRLLHTPAEAQTTAQQEPPPAPEATQPAPEAAPAADAASEQHGLVVPPPPPAAGEKTVAVKHVNKAARANDSVPPPPPPVNARARKAAAPSGREFEAAEPRFLPSAPAEEPADASQAAPTKGVGYKSLMDAEPDRAAPDPALQRSQAQPAQDQPAEKPKGNRFFRAVGKIFRPGVKKESTPLTLQQPKP